MPTIKITVLAVLIFFFPLPKNWAALDIEEMARYPAIVRNNAFDAGELVDGFKKLSREKQKEYDRKSLDDGGIKFIFVSASGVIKKIHKADAGDEIKTFDTGEYDKAITQMQKSPLGFRYQIIFCFQSKEALEGIKKDQPLSTSQTQLLKITDWGYMVNVWVAGDAQMLKSARDLYYLYKDRIDKGKDVFGVEG